MKYPFLSTLLFFFSLSVFSQSVTITPSGITPTLPATYPRIAYDEILALPNPALGDMAYDITFRCLRVYNGTKWLCTYQTQEEITPNITAITSAGGVGFDSGYDVALDDLGNIYVTGYYQGSANFGSTVLNSVGGYDLFIAKYSSSGLLQWVQSAGGMYFDSGYSIAVDGLGNVCLTGSYQGTATFGSFTLNSTGESVDVFVAQYNSGGSIQWVRSMGGASFDVGYGIAVDGSGNIYLTGSYQDTATFGSTSVTSVGSYDVFIAQYSSSGLIQWVRSVGGASFDSGYSIAVDGSSNVYVTGSYQGTATFGSTILTSVGSEDVFVAQYNSSGSIQWVKSGGGTISDIGKDIAVDELGNVYVTGSYYGAAFFGETTLASAGGGADVFIAKYNINGLLQWVRSAGGTSSDYGEGITIDSSGNVYVTGSYQGTATFGNTTFTSVGLRDIFIVKYNGSGLFQWVRSARGLGDDFGMGIVVNGSSNVYVTGSYEGTTTFGNTILTTVGLRDVFVVRLDN